MSKRLILEEVTPQHWILSTEDGHVVMSPQRWGLEEDAMRYARSFADGWSCSVELKKKEKSK